MLRCFGCFAGVQGPLALSLAPIPAGWESALRARVAPSPASALGLITRPSSGMTMARPHAVASMMVREPVLGLMQRDEVLPLSMSRLEKFNPDQGFPGVSIPVLTPGKHWDALCGGSQHHDRSLPEPPRPGHFTVHMLHLSGFPTLVYAVCHRPLLCGDGLCTTNTTVSSDGHTESAFTCTCPSSYTRAVNLDGNVQCMPGELSAALTRKLRI